MSDSDILIIGGGISGLSVAWWLAQQGIASEIWEKETTAGGKIRTTSKDGYVMEQAASMMMNFRPEVDTLLKECGVDSQKIQRNRNSTSNRYVINEGKLQCVPMTIAGLFTSNLWSNKAKLRMMAEPFIPAKDDPDETVTEFINRRLGNEILEKAMEPFVAGTLASDPDLANACSLLPRMKALEQKFGSITMGIIRNKVFRKKTAMTQEIFSFEGGMSTLIKSLSAEQGFSFKGGYTVTSIEPCKNGWKVTADSIFGQKIKQVKHLVLCAPSYILSKLIKPVQKDIASLLNGIDYAPVSVVHLGFKSSGISQKLDGAGFLVPRGENLAINGNQWMSSMFNGRAPAEKHLLSSYLGGSRNAKSIDWDDNRCIDAVMGDLKKLLGLNMDPDFVHIKRHPKALPLYHGSYLKRWQEIDNLLTDLKGLHIEGNFCGGVSIRDRISRGQILASKIAAQMSPSENTIYAPLPPLVYS